MDEPTQEPTRPQADGAATSRPQPDPAARTTSRRAPVIATSSFGSRVPLIAAVAAVLIILLGTWLIFFRGTSGDEFVGTWAALDGSGGLVVTRSGDAFAVRMFAAGSDQPLAMTGKVKDNKLTLAFTKSSDNPGLDWLSGALSMYLAYDRDTQHLKLVAKDSGQVLGEFERTDELRLAPASPSPTPASSPSSDPAFDQTIRMGIDAIKGGIDAYAAQHSGMLPAAGLITKASFSQYVPAWPVNPTTGSDMVAGAATGDYTYTVVRLFDYTVSGRLTDGTDYTLSGASGTPSSSPSPSPSPSL